MNFWSISYNPLLAQDCSNSIANVLELLQSCVQTSKYMLAKIVYACEILWVNSVVMKKPYKYKEISDMLAFTFALNTYVYYIRIISECNI